MRGRYDPSVPLYDYWDGNVKQPIGRHSDFTSAMISCKYQFPLNSRYQIAMKAFPNNHDNGTQIVLLGYASEEIDIIENYTNIDDGNLSNPNVQSVGVHGGKYGSASEVRAEYSDIVHNVNLQTSMNNYGLIWDKWKTEFYFNNEGISGIVNQVCKQYSCPASWHRGPSLYSSDDYFMEANQRRNPIGNFNAMSIASSNGDNFVKLKYFPDYSPVHLYMGFGIRDNLNGGTSQYTASNTMDMDFVYVWLRANCSSNTEFSALAPNITDGGAHGTSYGMGKTVTTTAGNSIVFEDTDIGVFAATEEIALLDGFGAAQGSNFVAFITTCEPAWDSRVSNQSANSQDSLYNNNFATSLGIIKDNNLVIYSQDEVTIKSKQNNITSYELYTVMGSLVDKGISNSLEVVLQKTNFSNGVYYVRLQKDEGFDIKKILIQK